MTLYYADTVIGSLTFSIEKGFLRRIFVSNDFNIRPLSFFYPRLFESVEAYLSKGLPLEPFPLELEGTKFQKQVWQELTKIPYGKTLTYQNLAKNLENPMAVRAVANAVGKNPVPFFIPCHRVVRKDKLQTNYILGKEVKEYLLDLEKKSSS